MGLWLIGNTAVRSTGCFRIQLLWVFWAYIAGFISGFTNYFGWYRIPITPVLTPLVSLHIVAIGYAIIRHRLMDIRIVLRRSLVYSALIAGITVTYLLTVLITERWFQGFFGYRSIVATVLVAAFIAIFFNPLRTRLQALVDRALFKATPPELAEQRDQLLAEVRKNDQMKAVGALAAGLAHEVRNPLASIKTFTEHLNTHYNDPAFRAKFQKIVGGEVERINLIVQQLLDFAKPVPPKLAPVDVPRLLDDTLELLNSELVKHHTEVSRTYHADGALVLGDPQQLKQIFLNLILNSLQAMNGTGRLALAITRRNTELEVAIRDTGTGIVPEHLSRVFEPFFTTKETGTGLGLAVVQHIVEQHGGRIDIQSQPGQGTQVRISLPIAV